MKNIEDYIKNNTELFNEEPNEGHFERFRQKLQQQKVSKRRSLIRSSMRVASVAILLIMSGLYVSNRFFNASEQELNSNIEFVEAQKYYVTKINNGINSIKNMDGSLSGRQRAMLVREMSKADDLFKELQHDYQTTPDDPRILEAMINHYRMKAMIIDNIVNDLEKYNTKQKENNKPLIKREL